MREAANVASEAAAESGENGARKFWDGWKQKADQFAQSATQSTAPQAIFGDIDEDPIAAADEKMKPLDESMKNIADTSSDFSENMEQAALSAKDIGSASEVDFGAIAAGAQIIGGGAGGAGMTYGGVSMADAGGTYGGRAYGGGGMGGHPEKLDRIAMFLQMLVSMGKSPQQVSFDGPVVEGGYL
jgi:hypothetical protein